MSFGYLSLLLLLRGCFFVLFEVEVYNNFASFQLSFLSLLSFSFFFTRVNMGFQCLLLFWSGLCNENLVENIHQWSFFHEQ